MRRIGKSRRQLFEEIERPVLAPLPGVPFEYAEWKSAKVHPDYHIEVDKTFYSVPHQLIGRRVDPSDDRDFPCSSVRRQPCAPFAARGTCGTCHGE
jgi:hypothetical protein